MHRTWRIATHDRAYVKDLSVRLKITALVAQVLVARGHQQPESAENFLAKKLTTLHDPETLPGVSSAADRIVEAIKSGRRITIYGDYDVDGVTSTSLLWHCLRLNGAKVDYYIPCRLEEGYGLNCDAIRQLHEEDPTRMIVSVDCGITSCAEAALAKELGLELIITDHHNFAAALPDAGRSSSPSFAWKLSFWRTLWSRRCIQTCLGHLCANGRWQKGNAAHERVSFGGNRTDGDRDDC